MLTKEDRKVIEQIKSKEIDNSEGFSSQKACVFRSTPKNSMIIDVGCRLGYWMRAVNELILPDLGFDWYIRMGIDPIDYGHVRQEIGKFQFYYKRAIANINPQYRVFNIFNEPGCNSLLKPTETFLQEGLCVDEHVYKAPSRDYWPKAKVESTVMVHTLKLEDLLDDHFSKNERVPIYYVKADCQGMDVDVILSLGKYLDEISYCEMEVSFATNDEPRIYEGENTLEHAVSKMREAGFELLNSQLFSSFLNHFEGELFFGRKK